MWWYRALHRRLLDALAGVHGTVLDAGCGTGGLLARLACSASGSAAGGRGVGRSGVPACRRQVGASLVRGTVNALPFRDACFDAAISADVLCHRAVEPTSALAELGRVLRPGGRLVINMPAYMWLASAHDRHVHNARRHTAGQLRSLLLAAGFHRLRVGYWNSLLLPLMIAQRKLLIARRRRLRCRPVSAMARCHVTRRDRIRVSPADPPACRRIGAGDRGATMNHAIDLLAPLSIARAEAEPALTARHWPVDRDPGIPRRGHHRLPGRYAVAASPRGRAGNRAGQRRQPRQFGRDLPRVGCGTRRCR